MLKSILVNGRLIHYDDPSNHHHTGEQIKETQHTQSELIVEKEEKTDVVSSVFDSDIVEPAVSGQKKKKNRSTL